MSDEDMYEVPGSVLCELHKLRRERDDMYQRALDAEAHAAFGPMDVDERVRVLRSLCDSMEREQDQLLGQARSAERKRAAAELRRWATSAQAPNKSTMTEGILAAAIHLERWDGS